MLIIKGMWPLSAAVLMCAILFSTGCTGAIKKMDGPFFHVKIPIEITIRLPETDLTIFRWFGTPVPETTPK